MIRPDLSSLPVYRPGARNDDAVKLSSNEANHPPLPAAQEAMNRAAAGANRYPDMGAVALRKALAQHLGVDFDEVAVGTGSSAICQQLVQITSTAESEVIFPWRSFEAYPIFVQVVGAQPVAVPLGADHGMDLAAMAAAITERTSLIFLCNPNNPTGTTITNQEFTDFMDKVPGDVIVALDEAYFEYNRAADTPDASQYLRRYPNLVGMRTFSKAYGLAGVRVGYAFGAANIIAALNQVAVPFSVNAVGQAGALASLADAAALQSRTDEAVEQRERVAAELADFGSPHSEANFVWLPAPAVAAIGTPEELAERIAAEGVLVRAFDEGIRITVTTTEETDALVAAFRAATAKAD
ncbi:histidinol-phosphate transaminase [Corynebacterium confusum]